MVPLPKEELAGLINALIDSHLIKDMIMKPIPVDLTKDLLTSYNLAVDFP